MHVLRLVVTFLACSAVVIRAHAGDDVVIEDDVVLAPPTPNNMATTIDINFFRNGGNNTGRGPFRARIAPVLDFDSGRPVLKAMKASAAAALGYKVPPETLQVFNRYGFVVHSLYQLTSDESLFLVPLNERWIWPGHYVGHKIPLHGVNSGRPGLQLQLETVSLRPRLFRIDNFLSDEECDALIALAQPKMFDSKVYEDDGQKQSDVRTSTQAWLTRHDGDVVRRIDERVAQLTHLPLEENLDEQMQVVHYDHMQHYHSHYDYFNPIYYPNHPDIQAGQQRLVTVFYYLNTPEEGGETVFPKGGPTGYSEKERMDFTDCKRGVIIKPTRGSAVLWYNLLADGHMEGALDDMTLHGGCNVIRGEKWGANKWIRNKNFARQ
eukprot:TRINITY_DN6940_c0_g1_i1.p1 TRINITY_DN6940_c0_g1~~TRINITY_DN6940_c0_g1_i1.p1  ORF type:complete len:408 (-),score=139.30 TRINITY_DN6940_c0_g1_i1:226-1362(-)